MDPKGGTNLYHGMMRTILGQMTFNYALKNTEEIRRQEWCVNDEGICHVEGIANNLFYQKGGLSCLQNEAQEVIGITKYLTNYRNLIQL